MSELLCARAGPGGHAELGAQAKNVLEAMLLVFGDVMDKAEISHRLQSNLRRFYPKVYERLVAERRNRDGLEQFKIALSRGVEEGYFQGIVNFDLAITLLRYSVEGLIVRKSCCCRTTCRRTRRWCFWS